MLQKLKVTSYAFIYFLLFGFSFIALQVTTEEVEAAGVCEPVDRIKQRNNADSRLWFQRCAQSGSKNTCGNMTEWPRGDGGRCEMTTADTVAAQDVNPTHAPVNVADQNNSGAVCHPSDRITERYNTDDHASYEYAVSKCAPEGVNEQTCETGWGKSRCQWGIPPALGPLNPAIVAKSQAIADCEVAVAATFNDLRQNVVTHDIVASLKTFPISESARSAYLREQRKQPSSVANSARAAELVELRTCR